LLSSLDQAEAEVTSRIADATGVLRLNVPVSYGIKVLAPLWGEFHRRYPRVKLDIELIDRTVDLLEEGYDLAIRIANLQNSTLVSKKLSATQIILCASPDYIRQNGEPRTPADLKNHQVIGYTYWSLNDEWLFNGPFGQERVKTAPFMQTNNGDTCVAAAIKGLGIILQPSFLVNDALNAGELLEIMPGYRSIELGVYAVYPTRKYLTPKVRVLIDFLSQHFEQCKAQN
jgi:DNA-binding transcriptional LysR family regulator